MYARVTKVASAPDRIDVATRFVQEQVLPQLQQMDGFKEFIALGGRGSGNLLGVALWESEEVLRATEEAAHLGHGVQGAGRGFTARFANGLLTHRGLEEAFS